VVEHGELEGRRSAVQFEEVTPPGLEDNPGMDRQGYMRRAIEIAVDNVRAVRGGPFGAVIARGDELIAEGANVVTASNDPTAHAEIVAIRRACDALGRFELRDCEIYSSCEPCPMCLGAIYWARLGRLWFACAREDAAAAGFDDGFLYDELPKPVERRSLSTNALLRGEGMAAFRAWAGAAKKIPY
jgi:tRNA(Arg) A34 adenosine deaminase TadA